MLPSAGQLSFGFAPPLAFNRGAPDERSLAATGCRSDLKAFRADTARLGAEAKRFRPKATVPCLGYEIGRDHARFGIRPTIDGLDPGHPVLTGWRDGCRSFDGRTRCATPATRLWLALRLQSWRDDIEFDSLHVTPHYLAQITGSTCPVRRTPLTPRALAVGCAVVTRVDRRRGFILGNLAVVDARAERARGGRDAEALVAEAALSVQHVSSSEPDGLTTAEWARWACLASLATPMIHRQASSFPLTVMPPNRLHVMNPGQGVQALLTALLLGPGYARRMAAVCARMPSSAARRACQVFLHTLLSRRVALGITLDPLRLRHGLEDAWRLPLVNQRWQALASHLDASMCEQLLCALAATPAQSNWPRERPAASAGAAVAVRSGLVVAPP